MKFIIKLLLSLSLITLPLPAFAMESTPIQLSLFHPVQLFSKETKVQGLRINLLYGVNDEMTGIDLGIVNRTTGPTQGLQLGFFPYGGFNITEDLHGLQFAGFYGGANLAYGNVSGLQLAGVFAGFNKANDLNGIQVAGVIGVNLANNTNGAQIATLFNQARDMKGFQLALVNVCESMEGLQIGLANIIKGSNPAFLPIVNGRF